jgi:hypothetical protein
MSVHHSDTNQSNEYASTNLLSLVLIASSRLSSLLCFLCLAPRATRSSLPCACASSTALRAGLPSKSPLRRPFSRREAQSTRLLRNMLALATKLQQGATHGTFTRQEDLTTLSVVLATAALAGGIVVAACLCGSSVGVLRVARFVSCSVSTWLCVWSCLVRDLIWFVFVLAASRLHARDLA